MPKTTTNWAEMYRAPGSSTITKRDLIELLNQSGDLPMEAHLLVGEWGTGGRINMIRLEHVEVVG